jgi:hypothetical protein
MKRGLARTVEDPQVKAAGGEDPTRAAGAVIKLNLPKSKIF